MKNAMQLKSFVKNLAQKTGISSQLVMQNLKLKFIIFKNRKGQA